MSCPDEATWAAYLDDETPRPERAALAVHLEACSRCRSLLAQLGEENLVLARALSEEPPAPPRAASLRGWAVTGAGLAVLAVGLQVGSAWFSRFSRRAPVGFVDERRVVLGLLTETVSYMLREGASMLESILTTFVLPAVIVLAGLALFALRRRWAAGALTLAGLLTLASPSWAIEVREAGSGHDRVLVPADETVDDTLVAAGNTVTVDGTITGNLIAAAHRVVVRGTVKGDLMTVAERIEIEGAVLGNVLAGADTLVLRGSVGRSLYGGGSTLRVDGPGRVDGDLLSFAEDLDLDGRVGRDLVVGAGLVNVRGRVGRDASIRARHLHLEGPAAVGGDLLVRVHDAADAKVDAGVVVSGKKETRVTPKERSRYVRPSFYAWRIVWLIAAFLTGLVLHALWPGLFPLRLPATGALWRTAGFGFLAFVALPVGAVILMLTLVGLPLGLLALALWLASLYVAKVLVATLVGRALLQRADAPPAAFAPALLVGLVILSFARNLPYLDGLVWLVVCVLGLGLAVVGVQRGLRRDAEA